MSDNQIDNSQTNIKNLSKESQDLLTELKNITTKAADIIPRLYASLRRDGLTIKDARNLIQSQMDVSDRTIRRALPSESKGTQGGASITSDKTDKMSINQAKLADVTPVTIPPPEQRIIEQEQEQEESTSQIEEIPQIDDKKVLPIRLIMSPGKFSGLANYLRTFYDKHGPHYDYVIEYDPADKELYVDVSEPDEKRNVND